VKIYDIKSICNCEIANICENKKIKSLSYNSKDVEDGGLFFAIKGEKHDGNIYAEDAIKKGALCVVSENPSVCKYIKVQDIRKCMGIISDKFFNEPSKKLNCVGITGTNGKTTATYILNAIFPKSDIIGTTGYTIEGKIYKLSNTTPESVDLQKIFSKMVSVHDKFCFMEVSAHAVTLKRTSGTKFRLKIFTNISQDHLDYYSTMEKYAKAKLDFFDESDDRIINIDDAWGRKLIKRGKSITYGFSSDADIYPKDYTMSMDGLLVNLNVLGKQYHLKSHLVGKYNIYNIMAAVGSAIYFNRQQDEIEYAIENFRNPPGRLEIFKKNGAIAVVDYAHTNDAMKNVLSALKEIVKKRLIVVFGAGGDRDRTKRSKMGQVAERLCDIVYITSDNPRSEKPQDIIDDILSGVNRKSNIFVEIDRKKAIINALALSEPGDIVAILGKGHEDYQILDDKVIHFDDREVVKEYWNLR